MRANRIHRFGPPEVITLEDVEQPVPGEGEVLIRVKASGVGPWDGWIREGKSVLPQPLPLTLGSDVSGVVVALGAGVERIKVGDEIFGVTNPRFTGANAEYALASAKMIAPKPEGITHVEAASVPVVAVTASQLLFDHGQVRANQTVLILGAAGNVGSYAVQLAHAAGAHVIASAARDRSDYVRNLGAARVFDGRAHGLPADVKDVDVLIDAAGGQIQAQAMKAVRKDGVTISAVSRPDQDEANRLGIKASFMLVEVTSGALTSIAKMLEKKDLMTNVGTVLGLAELRRAHEMIGLERAPIGKIVIESA
ncbi:NADP-dependent oxidoreductase [Hyphomicrobium sp.]|uniref:NADP-dependent oxidoreductase n=1 Tax=Hyphomicrobium sp. TaxID=82 RepID=UPI000F9973F6|nr:NADP-dependent oxidoreductase [Hyphomicrobium sp.]RUO97664.1 MAG: NADP-dependent oxidoreductase [Hyphomicrobium sp.]